MSIAIVTGASSGMGRDFVYGLSSSFSFSEIWVIARRGERLEEIREELGPRIVPIALDLTLTSSIDKISSLLASRGVEVGALVNASGFGVFKAFTECSREEMENMIDLNCRSLVSLTHTVLPYMKEGSFIINLGSNSSHQPVPYMSIYAATKAFVLSFSLSLGVELKKRGIFVECVCPGWIKTECFSRAVRENTTIVYDDRYYESKDVVKKALKDLKKKRSVSILGFPVRMQVLLVKILPVKLIMSIWCKQQKK